jgi:hypothetical protein
MSYRAIIYHLDTRGKSKILKNIGPFTNENTAKMNARKAIKPYYKEDGFSPRNIHYRVFKVTGNLAKRKR